MPNLSFVSMLITALASGGNIKLRAYRDLFQNISEGFNVPVEKSRQHAAYRFYRKCAQSRTAVPPLLGQFQRHDVTPTHLPLCIYDMLWTVMYRISPPSFALSIPTHATAMKPITQMISIQAATCIYLEFFTLSIISCHANAWLCSQCSMDCGLN